MKFYKSAQEVKDMLASYDGLFPEMKGIAAMVETTPEFSKLVLPPHLTPDEKPIVCFNISESKLFDALTVGISCSYKGEPGFYGVGFVLDSDNSIIRGREIWGEPKKQGTIKFERDGNKIIATTSRMGEELVRIEADVVAPIEDTTPMDAMRNYHYKYTLSSDAKGIDPAELVEIMYFNDVKKLEFCQNCTIKTKKTEHDLYGDIPVVNVLQTVAFDLDCKAVGKTLARDIDPDSILQFAFQKHDDYKLLGY